MTENGIFLVYILIYTSENQTAKDLNMNLLKV